MENYKTKRNFTKDGYQPTEDSGKGESETLPSGGSNAEFSREKLNNDSIRPGVGVPLLDKEEYESFEEGVLSEEAKEIIMQGAEKLIAFSNEDEGQSFDSPEEEAQYKECFEDTEESPDYEQQAYLRVELQNGEVDIYDNVDRMAADGGDQLLHLYREGEQVAFYQVRSVLRAAFSNEHY